jgi:hypothetical protein
VSISLGNGYLHPVASRRLTSIGVTKTVVHLRIGTGREYNRLLKRYPIGCSEIPCFFFPAPRVRAEPRHADEALMCPVPASRVVGGLAHGGYAKGATLEAVHARAAVAVEAGRGTRPGQLMTLSSALRRDHVLRAQALRADSPGESEVLAPCGRSGHRSRNSLRCQRGCTCNIDTRSANESRRARDVSGGHTDQEESWEAGDSGVPAT